MTKAKLAIKDHILFASIPRADSYTEKEKSFFSDKSRVESIFNATRSYWGDKRIPVKRSHKDDTPEMKGYVTNLRLSNESYGAAIRGDVYLFDEDYENYSAGKYTGVSIECPQIYNRKTDSYPRTITGVALCGHEIPAISESRFSMNSIYSIAKFDSNDSGKVFPLGKAKTEKFAKMEVDKELLIQAMTEAVTMAINAVIPDVVTEAVDLAEGESDAISDENSAQTSDGDDKKQEFSARLDRIEKAILDLSEAKKPEDKVDPAKDAKAEIISELKNEIKKQFFTAGFTRTPEIPAQPEKPKDPFSESHRAHIERNKQARKNYKGGK